MAKCEFCQADSSPRMCKACQLSYHRYAFDCGDTMTALIWAARRARRYEQRRRKPTLPVARVVRR